MAAAKNPSRGERHYNARITDHEVRLILALVAERTKLLNEARKLTDDKIAAKFELHPSYIHRLAKRAARITA